METQMDEVPLDRVKSSISASIAAGSNSVILWVDDAAYLQQRAENIDNQGVESLSRLVAEYLAVAFNGTAHKHRREVLDEFVRWVNRQEAGEQKGSIK